ncbi:hypothetical protein BSKO_13820 [Bryopsis sp. KO-2023]|nr:hypothetical protein BSKO_13820 [Bryopsis sp. KO-2023]
MSARDRQSALTLGLHLVLVLTSTCGIKACEPDVAPLISGGAPAAQGRYPYFVSVQVNQLHSCGGVLISPNWVLTVAGCVRRHQGRERNLSVAIGGIKLFDSPCADVLDVKRIAWEPTDGDLALLELTGISKMQPIVSNFNGVNPRSNPRFTLIGFGRTSASSSFSQTLQEAVQLPLQPKRICLVSHEITIRRWLCAGEKSHACRGDWGSPLILPSANLDPSQDQLVGVTIFPGNRKQCGGQIPGVFVDISRNANWINSIIN